MWIAPILFQVILMPIVLACAWLLFVLLSSMQVETLAEAGSYEDALSLCAMCKVRGGAVVSHVVLGNGFPSTQCYHTFAKQCFLPGVCGLWPYNACTDGTLPSHSQQALPL